MDTQGPPLALRQHLKISTRLCSLDNAECVFLSRHRQVSSVIAGDLQEHSAIWSAFVSLSSGVQKTRAKAEACCYAPAVAHCMAHLLQALFMLTVHLNISEQSKVITRGKLAQMRAQESNQRILLAQVCCIAVISEQLDSIFFKNWFFFRQASCLFILTGQLA